MTNETEKTCSFVFKGKITFRNVDFIIEAKSLGEAMARAKANDFDDTVTTTADFADWKIDAHSGRSND